MAFNPLPERTFRVAPNGGAFNVVRMAPGDIDVLALDFADCLLADDTISGVPGWSATPSGIVTITGEALIGTTVGAALIIVGSGEGTVTLTCSATITPNSRTYKRSITVQVRSPMS